MAISDDEILNSIKKPPECIPEFKLPLGELKAYKIIKKKNNYQAIINLKFDGNSRCYKGLSCLHVAIDSNSSENVKAVLEKGANPNTRDDTMSMLMLAMKSKNKDIITLLLKYGADPLFQNIDNKRAIDFGNDDSRSAFIGFQGSSKPSKDLITSAKDDKTNDILYWIAKGKDFNKPDKNGMTPFHYACSNGNLYIAWTLYKIGAQMYQEDKDGLSPLAYAIKNNRLNIVKFWHKALDIKFPIRDDSPLMYAVRKNSVEIVRYLAPFSNLKFCKTYNAETPLFVGVREDHVGCVSILLDANPSMINDTVADHTIMMYAAKFNSVKTIKLLLTKNVNPNNAFKGSNPISVAVKGGNADAVKVLIEAGVDPNSSINNGDIPLMIAIQEGYFKIVEYLLEKGANIKYTNNQSETAFIYSVKYNRSSILETLLKYVKDNDSILLRRKCLHFAIENNKIDSVETIMKSMSKDNDNKYDCLITHAKSEEMIRYLLGADKKDTKKKGKSIFGAIDECSIPGIKYWLLDNPHSIESKNENQYTPIIYASAKGSPDIVSYLISIGANRFASTDDGTDAMSMAISGDYVDIVKLLLVANVDITSPRTNGNAPVSIACENGSINFLKLMKEQKLDFNKVAQGSETPIAISVIKGKTDCVRFLVNECDISPNSVSKDQTPIVMLAILNNQLEIFKFLVDKGADINCRDQKGNTLLHQAVCSGNTNAVSICIEKGININEKRTSDQVTPYLVACYKGDEAMMNFLEGKGANTDYKTDDNINALIAAAESGNLQLVTNLLNRGFDPDVKTSLGMTPLLVACKFGHLKIVKLLESKGVDFKRKDSDGHTAFYFSCIGGDKDITKLVYGKKGFDVNDKFENDNTVLHIAAMNGHLQVVKFLKSKKAKLLEKNKEGKTPFHYAAMNNHVDVMEFIWKETHKDKDPVFIKDNDDNMPIVDAISNYAVNAVEFCLSKNCRINTKDKSGKSQLHRAAAAGDVKAIRILLKFGADINEVENNETPITVAINNEQWEVVKLLKNMKANFSSSNSLSGMHRAVQEDNVERFEMLRQLGFNVNEKGAAGKTPLMVAIEKQQQRFVSYLLDCNIDVNAVDDKGRTSLIYAVKFGNAKATEKLIDKGSNIDHNCDDATPLIISIRKDHMDCFKILLHKGAKLELPQKGGWYPIHEAAQCPNIEFLKKLLHKKVKIDVVSEVNKSSPLMCAVIYGNMENFKLLLEKGADINLLTKNGYNALHYAVTKGFFDMADILIQKGLKLDMKDANGIYLLEYCAMNNLVESIKYFLSKGTKPSIVLNGDTLLIKCIKSGSYDCAFMLIDQGVSVIISSNGELPIHACASRFYDQQSVQLAKKLIENGAYLNIRNKNKETPMSLTRWYIENDRRLAKFLKNNGAKDIDFEENLEYRKREYERKASELNARRGGIEATRKILQEECEDFEIENNKFNGRVKLYNQESDRLDNKTNSFLYMAFATDSMRERHNNRIEAHNAYGGAQICAQRELLNQQEKKLVEKVRKFKADDDQFNEENNKFQSEYKAFRDQLEIYSKL